MAESVYCVGCTPFCTIPALAVLATALHGESAPAFFPAANMLHLHIPVHHPHAGTAPPTEPMAGRVAIFDDISAPAQSWDTSTSLAPWRVALATLLPTLAVLLLAWQVGMHCIALHATVAAAVSDTVHAST